MNPDFIDLTLLITGGTLDKDYETTSGELVFRQTHLPEMLQQANCSLQISSQVLMLKDSLEMTDEDRQAILQQCLDTPSSKIVITHGTDTLTTTAETLLSEPALGAKTIVLTGAMRPFKLGASDASFNLGAALTAAQLCPAGVYVAMNGLVFAADQVAKNRTLGVFEARI